MMIIESGKIELVYLSKKENIKIKILEEGSIIA